MSAKQIRFHDRARDGMLRGVDLVARAVGVTMGPKGGAVFLDRHYATRVTKEGVGVAREIELADRFADLGVHLMRHAAVVTSDAVGDGTTLAVVLAQAIVHEGIKAVAAGMNPMDLRRGIEMAVAAVVDELRKCSHRAATPDELARLATIAANGDSAIGDMAAEALGKISHEGAITVEPGQTLETKLAVVEGLRFDRGYLSPHFINDDDGTTCELEDPHVLVCAQKLTAFAPLVPLLEMVARTSRPLLVIAEEVSGDALAALVANTRHGTMAAAAVAAPSFGERQKAMLQDIAVLSGARLVGDEPGLCLEDMDVDLLGSARRVIVTPTSTTLIEGGGLKKAIRAHRDMLRARIQNTASGSDREIIQERLAKLGGGVAVIRVGGATEAAVHERRDRFDMALRAARAAREEGFVAGGGSALVHAARVLNRVRPADPDRRVGVEIVRRALHEPLRRIACNAGYDGAFVAASVAARGDYKSGFDAQAGSYVDMFEAGIIDPTKVVCTALENAASVAGLVIATEVVVAVLPGTEAVVASSGTDGPAADGG